MPVRRPISCQTELNVLSHMAANIGRHLELSTVMDTALREIFSSLSLSHGCIYLFDPDTETLTIHTQKRLQPAFLEVKGRIQLGEGCAGNAALTQTMFAPTKEEQDYVCKESKELLGLDCLTAVPIVSQDEVLGVLELFAPVARRLSSSERELIEAVSNQLAVAIKNAVAHSHLQRALDNNKKLLRAAETMTATLEFDTILAYLAMLAAELTGVSRAAVTLYHHVSKEYEFAVSSGPGAVKGLRSKIEGMALRRIYEKGETLTIDDLHDLPDSNRLPMEKNHVKSILMVPLKFAGRVLGALYLDEPNVRHRFTPAEIELAEGIAGHAASSIQNASSFESRQRALSNAEGLLEAAEMVATVLDPGELLSQLSLLIPKLTGTRRSAIGLLNRETRQLDMTVSPTGDGPPDSGFEIEAAPFREVLSGGKTVVFRDPAGVPEAISLLMRRLHIKSLLLTPMHYGADTIGLIMLGDDRPRDFRHGETALMETISHNAAVGIANARSFRQQQLIADTLQQGFVPSQPPHIEGVEFGISYRSASDAALVGGDFYDFVFINDRLNIYIGDVSGRGIEAASLAGLVKSTFRAYAYEGHSPVAVVTMANEVITRQTLGHQFVTVNYGSIDMSEGIYRYVGAGHPPPLLVTDTLAYLPVTGQLPVGVESHGRYRSHKAKLSSGSTLVLYTDGIIESRRGGQMFGLERLMMAASNMRNMGPQGMVDGIVKAVEEFSEGHLVDDMAIVAVKIN